MSAGKTTVADLDERDRRIVQSRIAAYLEQDRPQVGDFVRFADGVERRISYVWQFSDTETGEFAVQTSDGGRFYLGDGYCSYSGSLHPGVRADTLTLTGSCRRGSCWIFHHDWHTAHNGVDLSLPMFSEWTSSERAPR